MLPTARDPRLDELVHRTRQRALHWDEPRELRVLSAVFGRVEAQRRRRASRVSLTIVVGVGLFAATAMLSFRIISRAALGIAPPTLSASNRAQESDLLERADGAERAGRKAEAARLLRLWLARHEGDPRASRALFALGGVERDLGRFEAAAEAFARCRQIAGGELAEHALAEEAVTRRSAALAHEYLRRHPGGIHARRMQALR